MVSVKDAFGIPVLPRPATRARFRGLILSVAIIAWQRYIASVQERYERRRETIGTSKCKIERTRLRVDQEGFSKALAERCANQLGRLIGPRKVGSQESPRYTEWTKETRATRFRIMDGLPVFEPGANNGSKTVGMKVARRYASSPVHSRPRFSQAKSSLNPTVGSPLPESAFPEPSKERLAYRIESTGAVSPDRF